MPRVVANKPGARAPLARHDAGADRNDGGPACMPAPCFRGRGGLQKAKQRITLDDCLLLQGATGDGGV